MLGLVFAPPLAPAASITEDASGFVVMQAEDFDLNVTQDTGQWLFDNAPPAWAPFTGWGYMVGLGAGGTNMTSSTRLDFRVNFTTTGPHYIWILGSDAGTKELHLGLDGLVTTNTYSIGGEDGAFGGRGNGEWLWVGTNNTGTALRWINKSYLDVPSAAEHTVNVFMAGSGLAVDKIVLTTNADWLPDPLNLSPPSQPDGGAANIPAPALLGSPTLSVALTQPDGGRVFTSDSNLVVTLVAKPVTNGVNSVTKIEFFQKKQPSGTTTKIGEKPGAPPWMFGWTNPAVGFYDLTARVTDTRPAPNNVSTSAPVTVQIKQPPVYLTPLVWTTNDFDTGLGSWTRTSQNHASGFITNDSEGWVFQWYFNLDWTNTSLCGGLPGEFGGHGARMKSVAPMVGEPLRRRVSLNEELWFRGRGYCRNYGPNYGPTPPATNRIDCNADVFIGYFDSTVFGQPPRVGLKIREASNTYPSPSNWRIYVTAGSDYNLGAIVGETNGFDFELHWTPSGAGDGSGTLSGSVAGTAFSVPYGASTVNYDTFGFLAPAQGSDEPWRQQDDYFDNLAYVVPATQKLDISLLSGSRTLLSWAIPDHILQYADGALPTTHTNAAWIDISPGSYVNVGGRYYYTNTIGASARWFQLRHPLQ